MFGHTNIKARTNGCSHSDSKIKTARVCAVQQTTKEFVTADRVGSPMTDEESRPTEENEVKGKTEPKKGFLKKTS